MAYPSCPRAECNSHYFDASEIEPSGSNYKMMAIHCHSCGAVVGVTEVFNVAALLLNLAKKLNIKLD